MAKMTSLKLSKTEAKTEMGGPYPTKPNDENLPRYPYGTKIRLENEVLEKLGIDLSDYPKGSKCTITAKVEVVGFSSSDRQGGKERNELELQITDMAIEMDGEAKKAKNDAKHLESISGGAAADDDDY